MELSEFDVFPVPLADGYLALSPIPGRSGSYEADLSRLLVWSPDLVLTMTTQAEMDRMGASGLEDDLRSIGVGWHHFPIMDFGAPDEASRFAWLKIGREAHEVFASGGKVLVHCFGGCGRSGMVALRLMVERGEAPEKALERLRQVRPCAVETAEQIAWASEPSGPV